MTRIHCSAALRVCLPEVHSVGVARPLMAAQHDVLLSDERN